MDESELTVEEAKERKIMKLLLKVKNGTPPQRKSALRQLTGAGRGPGRVVRQPAATLAGAVARTLWLGQQRGRPRVPT